MTLIARPLTWLYQALRLQEPEIPIDLDTERVISNIDMTQGGRAYSVFLPVEVIQPASTVATEREVIPADETLWQLIWIQSFLNGTAAASTISMTMEDTAGGGRRILWLRSLIAANTLADSNFLFTRGEKPILLPPRWRFLTFFGNTLVAESQVHTLLIEQIPLGFNPF